MRDNPTIGSQITVIDRLIKYGNASYQINWRFQHNTMGYKAKVFDSSSWQKFLEITVFSATY
jgi:hypothetical protein